MYKSEIFGQNQTIFFQFHLYTSHRKMIKHSFLKYGISNAMDGSEDDALFLDDSDDQEDVEINSEDNNHTNDYVGDVSEEIYNELCIF